LTPILETGKDGYDCDCEFDERTAKAIRARGTDPRLFTYDAVEVRSFVESDFRVVVPVLADLKGYRILDLGCGYGRLAPFLSGFDCAEYLGVDRVPARVEHARTRYGGGICRFEVADILRMDTGPDTFDVVWTSNVLQHLVVEDKLRLVETAKRARAPGGVVLLREAEVVDLSREEAEARYASDSRPRHMVPIPLGEFAEAFEPLKVRRLGGIVWMAEE
jgi:SAM-dependent methyltransferase